MGDEVYYRLRDFLDKLPGGFPSTEEGTEIKLLKKFFTPEEAEIALHLRSLPEPPSKIAERMGRDPAEISEKLEDMAKAGSIYRLRMNGGPLYMAIQFVIGIYEFHLNGIDRETAELMEEYLPRLARVWKDTSTKQLRVSPSVAAVDTAPAVETYDNIRDRVKEQTSLAVAECICRKEQDLLEYRCERPWEVCMTFGHAAEYYIENGIGRRIDVNEALSILEKAEEAALVLSPSNTRELMNVCCCCGCCCGILRNLKQGDEPAKHVHASFKAKIDPQLCSACGTCEERCQMEAVIEGDVYEIDEKRCIGCALCVNYCPEEAISLVERPREEPPKNMPEMSMKIMKERGML